MGQVKMFTKTNGYKKIILYDPLSQSELTNFYYLLIIKRFVKFIRFSPLSLVSINVNSRI